MMKCQVFDRRRQMSAAGFDVAGVLAKAGA
jgi:hypothetical protein